MTPAQQDTRGAVQAIRDGWARHRAAVSRATATRLLDDPPALLGLDDIDPDVLAELLPARDRSPR